MKNKKSKLFLGLFTFLFLFFALLFYFTRDNSQYKNDVKYQSALETTRHSNNDDYILMEIQHSKNDEVQKNETETFSDFALADQEKITTARVKRVIDGDTIELESGQIVRYIGIDTPETVHPSKPVQCFGVEASNKNKELVLGKEIKLEKDISETDKNGRLLRYTWLDNVLINDLLIRHGYAVSSTHPPDVKYQDKFLESQRLARQENRGLWSACENFGEPSKSNSFYTNQNENCLIKGNISKDGEKIYHTPRCKSYEKTVIDESKGEKWFCSEDEAVNSGFRKAKNCP